MNKLIVLFVTAFFAVVVGCEQDPSSIISSNKSNQYSEVSKIVVDTNAGSAQKYRVETLADTIASYYVRGTNFFMIYKENPHPDVLFKDTTTNYLGEGETKLYFRNNFVKTYPHIMHSGGSVPRNIYGGWVNPTMYILAVQKTYPAMYYGAEYDFWVIKDGMVAKPILIPKTTQAGYYNNAMFENGIMINEARIFEGKIIFHSKPGYAAEIFSMFLPDELSFINCYRKFRCCQFTEFDWQW